MIRVIFLSIFLCSFSAFAAEPADFQQKIDRFIDEVISKHSFDAAQTKTLMQGARYKQSIIDAISRPAERVMTWKRYRPIFLSGSRADEGVKFWKENQVLLNQAQEKYSVPPHIIVAIIGVETRYGKHAGKYRVIDALSTLAFGYPKRGAFFKKQLEEFLLMSREHNVNPKEALGSYAGAMGQPQFIPSSYRAYAVDFNQDGKTDLWHSNADVIGSVAAYFSRHKWKPNAPIAFSAKGVSKSNPFYVESGQRTAKPSIKVGQLRAAGIRLAKQPSDKALSTVVHLKGANDSEFWVTLHNFYVITRYNHSNLYAMAVHQLSQEILTKYRAGQ